MSKQKECPKLATIKHDSTEVEQIIAYNAVLRKNPKEKKNQFLKNAVILMHLFLEQMQILIYDNGHSNTGINYRNRSDSV